MPSVRARRRSPQRVGRNPPGRRLASRRRRLDLPISPREQQACRGTWRPDYYPPLGAPVVCQGRGVLRELEAQCVHEEADSRVVLADHDGDKAEMHVASIGDRSAPRREEAANQPSHGHLTRSQRLVSAFPRRRIVKSCTRRFRGNVIYTEARAMAIRVAWPPGRLSERAHRREPAADIVRRSPRPGIRGSWYHTRSGKICSCSRTRPVLRFQPASRGRRRPGRRPHGVLFPQPSGASSSLEFPKANKRRSTMRKVPSSGPRLGRQSGSRTIDVRLPSIARWKTSATIRPPTPVSPDE
jgi:hypothetical protein